MKARDTTKVSQQCILKMPEKKTETLPSPTHSGRGSRTNASSFKIDRHSSGDWLRWPRELIPHVLQTTNQLVLNLAAIPLLEKLHAFLLIFLPGFHHLTIDDENIVSNGQCCSFAPPTFFQTAIPLPQVGTASTHPMSGLYQHLSHIPIAFLTLAT